MRQPAQSAGAINFSALFSFLITVRPERLPTRHPPQVSCRQAGEPGLSRPCPALPSMHLLVEAPTIINHSTVLILAKPVCLNNYVNTLGCLGPTEILTTFSISVPRTAQAPGLLGLALPHTHLHARTSVHTGLLAHIHRHTLHKAISAREKQNGRTHSKQHFFSIQETWPRNEIIFRYQSGWLS